MGEGAVRHALHRRLNSLFLDRELGLIGSRQRANRWGKGQIRVIPLIAPKRPISRLNVHPRRFILQFTGRRPIKVTQNRNWVRPFLPFPQGKMLCGAFGHKFVLVSGFGLESDDVAAVGEFFGLEADRFARFPVGEIALVGGTTDQFDTIRLVLSLGKNDCPGVRRPEVHLLGRPQVHLRRPGQTALPLRLHSLDPRPFLACVHLLVVRLPPSVAALLLPPQLARTPVCPTLAQVAVAPVQVVRRHPHWLQTQPFQRTLGFQVCTHRESSHSSSRAFSIGNRGG